MKTKEELNALKAEVENLNEKLASLSEEEMSQLFGGFDGFDGVGPIKHIGQGGNKAPIRCDTERIMR